MKRLVIDAGVSAKWYLSDEREVRPALEMLTDYAAGKVAFIAPKLWLYETANIFNKAVGIGRLTETEGQEAVNLLYAIDIRFINFPSPQTAYALARQYQRGVYDSLYLAAAQNNSVELWTGDRKLYNAAKDHFGFVQWIGNYS